MQLTCQKDALLNNINIVLKAVSSRTTLQILECILLTAEDDSLTLMSNDLEIGIKTEKIEANVTENGSIALEAKVFSEIVRRLPDDEVHIHASDNNVTLIKSGNCEFKILGTPGEEFPHLPEVERSERLTLTGGKFKEMVRKTIFSVAIDETKPILTGELVEVKNGEISLVAVDGFRISYAVDNLDTEKNTENIHRIKSVIPAKTLHEITKIIQADSETDILVYFTDRHVLFELENCTIVSRLLDGEYIKYDQIFLSDFTTVITVDRQAFLRSIERVALITGREAKKSPVKLSIKPEGMSVTCNTEMGTAKDEMPLKCEGLSLDIAFNPKYLLDALRAIDDELVTLSLSTALSPCVIKGVEDEQSRYLVLPLRVR